MCLDDTVVACWSLTQEVADSSPFNDNYSVKSFRKNSDEMYEKKTINALQFVKRKNNLKGEIFFFFFLKIKTGCYLNSSYKPTKTFFI